MDRRQRIRRHSSECPEDRLQSISDADANVVCDKNSKWHQLKVGHADFANANLIAIWHADAGVDEEPECDAQCVVHADDIADTLGDTVKVSNGEPDRNAELQRDGFRNGNSHDDEHADRDTIADVDGHPDADPNADQQSHRHSEREPDSQRGGHALFVTDRLSVAVANTDAKRDGDAKQYPQRYAEPVIDCDTERNAGALA